jgi:hypothetical protein
MNAEYWDKKIELLQPIGGSKEGSIKILKQISADQREADIKAIFRLCVMTPDTQKAIDAILNAEISNG